MLNEFEANPNGTSQPNNGGISKLLAAYSGSPRLGPDMMSFIKPHSDSHMLITLYPL
jgi:hypothetical protein